MSESTLHNIPANTLRPGPNFAPSRSADGRITATMDFTCRKYDIGKTQIQTKLKKGNSISVIYPQVLAEYGFLVIDSWSARDDPGGITTVTVNFIGIEPSDQEFSNDASVIYTRNNALREESIFNHPKFRLLDAETKNAIKAASDNTARFLPVSGEIRTWVGDTILTTITSADAIAWNDHIVVRGNLTFLVPTSEWTKTATGRGRLKTSELSKMGFIDESPPGNPTAPTGQKWLFTGATESLTLIGESPNSYSLTWTSGDWDELIYTPPT
jgi:hypothetical protein